jgi:hypothetical protein
VATGTVAQVANDATAFVLAGVLVLVAALGVRWRTRR